MKITFDEGLAFFIRTAYLKTLDEADLTAGAEFSGEDAAEIIDAGTAFTVEKRALAYLARAEHSRFGLERKLRAKNCEAPHIKAALDYLERAGTLSDARFARAWLNSRKIQHAEGRTKLEQSLRKRGISKEIAAAALDDFLAVTPEQELCRREYAKCIRLNKDRAAIIRRLHYCGFPYALIKKVMHEGVADSATPPPN